MHSTVSLQKNFFNTNATKDIDFRIANLKKLRGVIESNIKLFDDAIYQDFQKSKFENFSTELALLFDEIDFAIKSLRKWIKPQRVKSNLINFPSKNYIYPEPLGVVLVIGAWNYPYQLSLSPAIAALSAGCTVILKPSEVSINCSNLLAKLINENFDPSYFTVVEGGIETTTKLLEERFDKIFFTGSTSVGRVIYMAAAKHLTPVVLELGGKSPAFVTDSCNIDVAAKRIVWAKFVNAGQTCIAPDYVLVDSKIEKLFLEKIKKEIINFDFSVENKNYVQIINEKNFDRLIKMIDPSKIYCGGKSYKDRRIIEPTIMYNVDFGDKIMEEEIFGPILPIISYDNIDAPIGIIKSGAKPLSCYIFTAEMRVKRKLIGELSFGGGAVNDALMHITNGNLPFGGVGDSGTGSYHHYAGFVAFSHFKSVLEKSTYFDLKMKYPPYTEQKMMLIKKLFNVKNS